MDALAPAEATDELLLDEIERMFESSSNFTLPEALQEILPYESALPVDTNRSIHAAHPNNSSLPTRKRKRGEKNAWRERMQTELKDLRAEKTYLESTLAQLQQRQQERRANMSNVVASTSWQKAAIDQNDFRVKSQTVNQQLRVAITAQQRLIDSMRPLVSTGPIPTTFLSGPLEQIPSYSLEPEEQQTIRRGVASIYKTYASINDLLVSNNMVGDDINGKQRLANSRNNQLHLKAVDCCELSADLESTGKAAWTSIKWDLGASAIPILEPSEREIFALRFDWRYRSIAKQECFLMKAFRDTNEQGKRRVVIVWESETTGDKALLNTHSTESGFCLMEEVDSRKTVLRSITEVFVTEDEKSEKKRLGLEESVVQAVAESYQAVMEENVMMMKRLLFNDEGDNQHTKDVIPGCWLFCRYGPEKEGWRP